MPLAAPLLETRLNGLAPHRQGKVRDIYDVGDALLMVATDRISAFDYVLGSGIPDKGKVLTQFSAFWFEHTRHIVPNHLIARRRDFPPDCAHAEMLAGRSMLVRKTTPVPIECVARGYLSGSGWKDYQATGAVCGVTLPAGLRESDRLPQPIFTPATKATSGHDVNISEAEAGRLVGADLVATLRDLTLELYAFGAAHAESRGIILADTKFEFGLTDTRRDHPHRRSDDAGLVALLAARSVRARAGRSRASTSSSCAITSNRSAGTSSRPSRRCPTTSCCGRARSTSKPTAASPGRSSRDGPARTARTAGRRNGDARASASRTRSGSSRSASSRTCSPRPTAICARRPTCSACTATR